MKNSSNKILTIAVVLLLLINIALVIFMMQGPKKVGDKKQRVEPFEMMATELAMTDQQKTDYKAMKEEHMKNIRPLFDSVRAAKTAFFALIKQENVSDSMINAYSQRITEKQSAIDKLTFAHFKRVRVIFTAEQQPKFDEFIQKMMNRKKDSAAKKEKN
jgi:periplasmic protein CpxP/Spy